MIGVLGKNGAGKTTLLELMLGFTPPTSGACEFSAHESHSLPGDIKAASASFRSRTNCWTSSASPNNCASSRRSIRSWDSRTHQRRLCGEWGVDLKARIKSMSVGERQKLSILLAFGHKPDLLILDEPVASLDPMARRQFLEQLVELSADGQRAIVFSSHIVSDIERLANRIWILKDGRLDWQGDLDSLKESIVRLHIRGARLSCPRSKSPALCHDAARGAFATAVVRDWTPEVQQSLENSAAVQIEVESLGLEEIFLELHR